MFVISGLKAKVISTKELPDDFCKKCKHEGLKLEVLSKYFHLYWIPIFGYGKGSQTTCPTCKDVVKEAQLTRSQLDEVNRLKSTQRMPIRHFSGLIIVGSLFLLIWYTIWAEDRENRNLVETAAVGDFYVFYDKDISDYSYSLMKVIEVRKDTVDAIYSQVDHKYSSDFKDDIKSGEEADSNYYYFDLVESFSKQELMDKVQSGELDEIIREKASESH